jgi:Xaa-Pro aminopeptidase
MKIDERTKKRFSERILKLKERLREPLLVSLPHHLFYLTGFTGFEGYLLVTKNEVLFFLDGRYWTQYEEEVDTGTVELVKVSSSSGYLKSIAETLNKLGSPTLLFEEELSYRLYRALRKEVNAELVPVETNPIKEMREVKDEWELEIIRKGAEILKSGYRLVERTLLPGMREVDVALEMEYHMRKAGGRRRSFEFIVASGWRSALPHGMASEKRVEENEVITVDSGIEFGYYQTDMTRNFFTGKELPSEVQRVWEAVREADEGA